MREPDFEDEERSNGESAGAFIEATSRGSTFSEAPEYPESSSDNPAVYRSSIRSSRCCEVRCIWRLIKIGAPSFWGDHSTSNTLGGQKQIRIHAWYCKKSLQVWKCHLKITRLGLYGTTRLSIFSLHFWPFLESSFLNTDQSSAFPLQDCDREACHKWCCHSDRDWGPSQGEDFWNLSCSLAF